MNTEVEKIDTDESNASQIEEIIEKAVNTILKNKYNMIPIAPVSKLDTDVVDNESCGFLQVLEDTEDYNIITKQNYKSDKINDKIKEDVEITNIEAVNIETVKPINSTTKPRSMYYTVFSYQLARKLIRNGGIIADIGLNKNMKGIVFHFYNTELVRNFIAREKENSKKYKEYKEGKQNEN